MAGRAIAVVKRWGAWLHLVEGTLPEWAALRGTLSRQTFLLTLLPVFTLAAFLAALSPPLWVGVPLGVPLVLVLLVAFVRRLRDAGLHPGFVALGVIPAVGWVGLAALAAQRTAGVPPSAKKGRSVLTGVASFATIALVASLILPTTQALDPGTGLTASDSLALELEEAEGGELDDLSDLGSGGPLSGRPGDSGDLTGGEVTDEAEDARALAEPTPEPESAPEPAPVPESAPESATEPAPVDSAGDGFDALVAQLRVEPEFQGGYDRSLFRHWVDASGNGCDARREVLIRQSRTPVSVGARCSISGGEWYSAFDGVVTRDPSTFDIDHFVPLAEAWRSGAHAWDSGTRQRFANDLDFAGSLIAVSASSNRQKGSRDPAGWLPPNGAYLCTYLVTWVNVKLRWDLSADTSEVSALRSAGSGC